MTMDTQSFPCPRGGPRGGTWTCPTPPPGAAALAALGAGVSVIRSPHSHPQHRHPHPHPRGDRAPRAEDGDPRARRRSPPSRSRSPSSSDSSDGGRRLDRPRVHRLTPEPPLPPVAPLALRDGLGVIGYPYSFPYPFCDAAGTTPPSPGLPSTPPSAPTLPMPMLPLSAHVGDHQDALEAVTALSDLYAPLQHGYPFPLRPLRPWLPWRGLGAPPLAAPHCAVAASAPPPGPALKFGMDRILSSEGCGAAVRRGTPVDPPDFPRELVAFPVPGLLAPTPLRIYGHAADTRTASSPPRGGAPLGAGAGAGSSGKRKRSWSRAVFSNLQRKGLEKRFQLQKYITKPDRRQLAATLGLTDAQVKVWFQNRRMKWRHTKESKPPPRLDGGQQDAPKGDVNSTATPRPEG